MSDLALRTQVIELPWVPSINHYYRRVGPRTLINPCAVVPIGRG